MALGILSSLKGEDAEGNVSPEELAMDPEKQGGPRRGSRIDKPITKPIVMGGDTSDTETQTSVGKQMELEADNAIKYRTCSWQKVNYAVSFAYALIVPSLALLSAS
jgi:hypothetical protein